MFARPHYEFSLRVLITSSHYEFSIQNLSTENGRTASRHGNLETRRKTIISSSIIVIIAIIVIIIISSSSSSSMSIINVADASGSLAWRRATDL